MLPHPLIILARRACHRDLVEVSPVGGVVLQRPVERLAECQRELVRVEPVRVVCRDLHETRTDQQLALLREEQELVEEAHPPPADGGELPVELDLHVVLPLVVVGVLPVGRKVAPEDHGGLDAAPVGSQHAEAPFGAAEQLSRQ